MAKVVIKRLLGWIVLIWRGLTKKISFGWKSSNNNNKQALTKKSYVFCWHILCEFALNFCWHILHYFLSNFGHLFEKQLLDMQPSVLGTSSRYLLILEKVFSPTELCVSWSYFEQSGLAQGKSLILMPLQLLHLQLHGSFWGAVLKSKILILPW